MIFCFVFYQVQRRNDEQVKFNKKLTKGTKNKGQSSAEAEQTRISLSNKFLAFQIDPFFYYKLFKYANTSFTPSSSKTVVPIKGISPFVIAI